MGSHSSASKRKETSHITESTQNNTLNLNHTISNALKRRADFLIKDPSIDAQSRVLIRYALETNDPWLPELVRRADAGETIIPIEFTQTPETENDDSTEEKVEALAEIICRAGDQPAAALLVLMATIQNSSHPKALANLAKHLAFTRCGELNLYGMVDAQIPLFEGELLADNTLAA